jgi:hypothetical protein
MQTLEVPSESPHSLVKDLHDNPQTPPRYTVGLQVFHTWGFIPLHSAWGGGNIPKRAPKKNTNRTVGLQVCRVF